MRICECCSREFRSDSVETRKLCSFVCVTIESDWISSQSKLTLKEFYDRYYRAS